MRIITLALLLLPHLLMAQLQVSSQQIDGEGSFPIARANTISAIHFDSSDFELVGKASALLAADIKRVTGREPAIVSSSDGLQGNTIIVGTIGRSMLIDQLIAESRIDVGAIEGEWERFLIQTVENPLPGVPKALVIVGSDRRGAAFGVFTLTEAMGVSPWYWWADVPTKPKEEMYVGGEIYISNPPSVKYRGIFLNDEDWGLQPWAANTFDPELGDIGPRTYEKVFELVLRLKGNMVAPAMHDVTQAFYTVPGNMVMADDYGIMITTAHCEPLLYNNASEWDIETQGEWNYMTNKDEILRVLNKRVEQAAAHENIYTIALRGMHDEGMIGPDNDEMKLRVLEEATKDQREILTKYIDKPIEEIPQIFVPYKEVLDIYEMGMNLPNDITIVWPDDNYGYIKKLSNEQERQRAGGSGVYYHISYLGWPNDYLWLNSTPPALMFAELHKAFKLGANKYWLLNVGDIKPGEMGAQLFMDMAWDFSQFNFENIHGYEPMVLASIFGEEYRDDIAFIMDRYYYHGFTRKPEYMTWDYRWNSLFTFAEIKDTDLSFVHYREAETRLAEYNQISAKAKAILNKLPEDYKPAFFQMVYYPVRGASLYNHQMLIAQKNRWYAQQHRAETNMRAQEVRLYIDSLAALTKEYNTLLNGRWDGMMTAPGFLPEVQIPPTEEVTLEEKPLMALFVEGMDSTGSYRLPGFSKYFRGNYFFEVYNQGSIPFTWNATVSDGWIVLDTSSGKTSTQQRVYVSIDWDKAPKGSSVMGSISVTDGGETKVVEVHLFNPAEPSVLELKGLFVESNGAVSICPSGFHRKVENGGIRFQVVEGLGYTNSSLQLGNAKYDSGEGSYVEYDFYTFSSGWATIYTYALPLFAKDKSHSTQYAIGVNGLEVTTHHNDVEEWTMPWADNVMRNSAINATRVKIERPGKQTLRLYSVDPGMIIQKVVIDMGGLKDSYLGPRVSRVGADSP